MEKTATKAIGNIKYSLAFIVMLFSFSLQAQVDDEEQDTLQTGVDLGTIKLPNPISIAELYTYNSATDRYIYTNTVGDFNIKYPLILTPKQYQELVLRESFRTHDRQYSRSLHLQNREGCKTPRKRASKFLW